MIHKKLFIFHHWALLVRRVSRLFFSMQKFVLKALCATLSILSQLLFSIASAKTAQYSIRVTKSAEKNARSITQCFTTAPSTSCKYISTTLKYGIVVHVRLLIFGIFSHLYDFISYCTFNIFEHQHFCWKWKFYITVCL